MADRIWTADEVADHFEEAFRTLRKLPSVWVQGYFNAWPQILRSEKGNPRYGAAGDAGLAVERRDHPGGSSRPSTGCSGSRKRSASWSGPAPPAFHGSKSVASWGWIVLLRGGGGRSRSPRSLRGLMRIDTDKLGRSR